MNTPPTLTPQAEDLQRGYAAHTFALRGFLPKHTRPTPPRELCITLSKRDVVGGNSVDVIEGFPSAPLFAYLKDTKLARDVSLEINTFRDNSDTVRLTLMMPKQRLCGIVRLVWADAVAFATAAISVKGDSAIQRFEASNESLEGGATLRIPFADQPAEALLGGKEIPVTYESGELVIVLPDDAVSGHLTIVTTARHIFHSCNPVQIKPNKNFARASTAPAATPQK